VNSSGGDLLFREIHRNSISEDISLIRFRVRKGVLSKKLIINKEREAKSTEVSM